MSILQYKRKSRVSTFACKRYSQIRKKIKQEKQLNQLSLKMLFSSKQGQDFLLKYIEQTGIATRKNLLQNN